MLPVWRICAAKFIQILWPDLAGHLMDLTLYFLLFANPSSLALAASMSALLRSC